MPDLFEKCYAYNRPDPFVASGLYPYFKPIGRMWGPRVTVDGRDMIMIGSNNYLGLTTHPKVIEAGLRATEEYGTSCPGARFLDGVIALHEGLEDSLAAFMGKQAALVFSTGYITNQGVIAPLIARNDTVIVDRLAHASVIEGARLSLGKMRRFKHNDIDSLRNNLEASSDSSGVLVVVDGVYSMEGDLALLPEIAATAKEFGARVMVDDAHGIGVLGETGRGTLEHFGVADDVDLVMGTFSKSFASLGGFIAGSRDVISYIRYHSNALMQATAMPPFLAAAAKAALEVIQTEPEIRASLWDNTKFLLNSIREMGFDTGPTCTPIVPLIIGDDFRTLVLWKRLFDEGLFTNCVLAPAVPEGQQRIRTCLMATHTREDLEKVVEICGRIGRGMELIP